MSRHPAKRGERRGEELRIWWGDAAGGCSARLLRKGYQRLTWKSLFGGQGFKCGGEKERGLQEKFEGLALTGAWFYLEGFELNWRIWNRPNEYVSVWAQCALVGKMRLSPHLLAKTLSSPLELALLGFNLDRRYISERSRPQGQLQVKGDGRYTFMEMGDLLWVTSPIKYQNIIPHFSTRRKDNCSLESQTASPQHRSPIYWPKLALSPNITYEISVTYIYRKQLELVCSLRL